MSDEATRRLRERVSEKPREELLEQVAGLPPSAFIPTAHAAAYLASTPGVMLSWRSQRKGPPYHGRGNFIRYRIAELDLWMASRANEVRLEDHRSEAPSQAHSPSARDRDRPTIASQSKKGGVS